MSDPAKSASDIDDVLSSIRRLVAEQPAGKGRAEARPMAQMRDGGGRLVLTPALRVSDVEEVTAGAGAETGHDVPDILAFANGASQERSVSDEPDEMPDPQEAALGDSPVTDGADADRDWADRHAAGDTESLRDALAAEDDGTDEVATDDVDVKTVTADEVAHDAAAADAPASEAPAEGHDASGAGGERAADAADTEGDWDTGIRSLDWGGDDSLAGEGQHPEEATAEFEPDTGDADWPGAGANRALLDLAAVRGVLEADAGNDGPEDAEGTASDDGGARIDDDVDGMAELDPDKALAEEEPVAVDAPQEAAEDALSHAGTLEDVVEDLSAEQPDAPETGFAEPHSDEGATQLSPRDVGGDEAERAFAPMFSRRTEGLSPLSDMAEGGWQVAGLTTADDHGTDTRPSDTAEVEAPEQPAEASNEDSGDEGIGDPVANATSAAPEQAEAAHDAADGDAAEPWRAAAGSEIGGADMDDDAGEAVLGSAGDDEAGAEAEASAGTPAAVTTAFAVSEGVQTAARQIAGPEAAPSAVESDETPASEERDESHAEAAGLDLDDGEEDLLDEDTLRRIVAEVVREELQGALGERITRNVRKLVRREIRLVLAADELD